MGGSGRGPNDWHCHVVYWIDMHTIKSIVQGELTVHNWRQVLPVAIEHGVRDVPHAMMLLVRTFVLTRALYACQVWGPDMLQLSPCGQASLQSELLSICKHVLGLRGSVAQASLLDELGLQPSQILWLKACVKFFATACSASRGNPLLWEAMRANVELSKDGHKAWCARLAWFLKCIGALSCGEVEMCNPPNMDIVAQAVLYWAGSCRQQLLYAGATVQNTYRITRSNLAETKFVRTFFLTNICSPRPGNCQKWGNTKNSGSFLPRFFAFLASLQRYTRKPWCQALTMASGNA
jgi:hypothetical protein